MVPRVGVSLGRGIPPTLLRPYPIRGIQVVLANALGSLMDFPTLFALPVFVVIARRFAGPGGWVDVPGGFFVCLILVLFTLQTAALSQLLEQGWRWVAASPRRQGMAVALVAFAVLGSYHYLPMAGTPMEETSHRVAAGATVPAPALSWTTLVPGPGVAAQATVGISRGQCGTALLFGALLGASLLATLGGANWCFAQTQQVVSADAPRKPRRKARPLSPRFASPSLSMVAAVAGVEWRRLLRHPASYLPLRGPAMLFLTILLSLIMANGSDEPITNLRDLVTIAALLYAILCQIQLLCNRFGNEGNAARFLFALPTPRLFLFLGKNLALLGLLLPLDGVLVGLACLSAHARAPLTAAVLSGVGAALIVLTALGNLLSVAAPFPIARRDDRFHVEPDRLLLFAYGIVIAMAALAPVYTFQWFKGWMPAPAAGAVALILLGVLYSGSVLLAERLLMRNERRILRALEGRQ